MVTQFPGSDEMGDCEERAEHNADSCHNDVGDTEEGVLAAYHGACGDNDGFCAAVFSYVKI